MKKILILCTGNSCRSQMAHGILQSLNSNLEVHSAGTCPVEAVHPKAIQVISEFGLDLSSHKPTHVEEYLSDEWDYVITVCGGANENCPNFVGNVKNRVHIGFEDPAHAIGTEEEILNEFRRIRNEILKDFYTFYIKNIK